MTSEDGNGFPRLRFTLTRCPANEVPPTAWLVWRQGKNHRGQSFPVFYSLFKTKEDAEADIASYRSRWATRGEPWQVAEVCFDMPGKGFDRQCVEMDQAIVNWRLAVMEHWFARKRRVAEVKQLARRARLPMPLFDRGARPPRLDS
jgi:hypothetical protein